MKVKVIKRDKTVEFADLTDAAARSVSCNAAVAVVMTVAETPKGYHEVYIDGNVRQYDPVSSRLV